MAIRDLFFNILAKDKTANAFDKVKANLRGVEGAAASASARMKRVGGGIAKFGAGATAATAPLFLAFRDSVSLFDTQARAEAKVDQAIRSTGAAAGFTTKQLFGLASGLQDVTRFGDEQILGNVTGQLLTFTNIAGVQFARAQEAALDMATVLETDVKSVVIQLGKALNDPIKGLSSLGRAGVQFSEDQKKVIKSLVETGDIAGAQTAILDELAKQFGGQARRAAEEGIGPLIQFQNVWGDLKETVGGIIAELLPPLVGFFRGIVNGFQALPEPMQKFIVFGGLLATALGPVVALLGLVVFGLGAIGAPIALAIAGFAALAAGVVAFLPEIENLGTSIGETVDAAQTWLVDTFGPAWDAAAAGVSVAVDAIGGFLVWFSQAHIDAFNLAKKAVSEAVESITQWLTGKLQGAFDFVIGSVGKVKGAFFDLYDAVVGNSYIPDMVDEIGRHFDRLPAEMVDPAIAATGTVGGAFKTLGSDAVASLADMAKSGKFTFSSFADSLIGSANRMADQIIDDAFARVSDAAGSIFGQGSGGSAGSGGGFLSGLGGAVSGAVSSIFGGLPAFAGGADFQVGGRGGVDRNIVAFRANSDERVQVTRPGDAGRSGGVTVNISTPDLRSFQASRAQVSAQIARAVGRGQRNL